MGIGHFLATLPAPHALPVQKEQVLVKSETFRNNFRMDALLVLRELIPVQGRLNALPVIWGLRVKTEISFVTPMHHPAWHVRKANTRILREHRTASCVLLGKKEKTMSPLLAPLRMVIV